MTHKPSCSPKCQHDPWLGLNARASGCRTYAGERTRAVGNMHGMLKSVVPGEMKNHLDIGRIAEIWQSTLTMRASAAEYRSLHLRAHELLRDVPLFDVSSVDLPGGGSGRTIADIRTLESAAPPSHIATSIYGLRYLLGRVFGWDREPMRQENSFLERLSQRDRCDSEITPGTLDGHFLILYQFPGEALRETRNKTVHGFICTALVSSRNGYILYWGIYVRRASWLTRPYLIAIEPFRRVLYPAMLRRIRRAWIAAYVGMSRNDTAI